MIVKEGSVVIPINERYEELDFAIHGLMHRMSNEIYIYRNTALMLSYSDTLKRLCEERDSIQEILYGKEK